MSIIEDAIWEKLFGTFAPDVPLDTIALLIEKCQADFAARGEIISCFHALLDDPDEDWDEELIWLMVILAKSGSREAVPLFLQCLSLFPNYDYVLEAVDQCLAWMGEPALKEVMAWLKEGRSFEERLFSAGVFEAVLDYGDDQLVARTKNFLKDRVITEEEIEDGSDCFDFYLQILAWFPGDDVLSFVRSAVGRYKFHPELECALEIAEGRFPIEREKNYFEDWRKFCGLYAWRMDPDREEKDEAQRKRVLALFKDIQKESRDENWARVIELGARLRPFEVRERAIDIILCMAYMHTGMTDLAEKSWQSIHDSILEDWRLFPVKMDYKKDIESLAVIKLFFPTVSNEDRYFFISRFGDYMAGFLRDLGFAPYDAAIRAIKRMVNLPEASPDEMLLEFFQNQPERFVLKDDYIFLTSVKDPDLLLAEFRKRNISRLFPKSLTKIMAFQEGHGKYWYTDEENDLDKDIRIFSLGRWDLELFREAMRNDIDDREGQRKLIQGLRVYFQHFDELVDCVMQTWNISPRWELGGRSPGQMNESSDSPIVPPAQESSSLKTGRNAPCPCGSGKKFKKCCGG